MTSQEIEKRFSQHVVSYHVLPYGSREVEHLEFHRPGTTVDSLLFIRDRHRLAVMGDLGDAIYEWSEVKPLRWMANLDLNYFRSKCRASPCGIGFKSWNPDRVADCVTDILREEERGWDALVADGAGDASQTKYDWCRWLENHGEDYFGCDWYEFAEIGMDVDLLCVLQWTALRLACEKL